MVPLVVLAFAGYIIVGFCILVDRYTSIRIAEVVRSRKDYSASEQAAWKKWAAHRKLVAWVIALIPGTMIIRGAVSCCRD